VEPEDKAAQAAQAQQAQTAEQAAQAERQLLLPQAQSHMAAVL